MAVHAVVPEWLVADDEIESPVLGGVLRGDLEVWDASWQAAPDGVDGVTLIGRGEDGRPVSEVVGTARVPAGRHFFGFFVEVGDLCAYAYTGPYEGAEGHVDARPNPDDGARILVRGTLGFAPAYVTDGTFVPLRELDGRPDVETFLPTWNVVALERNRHGDWHVEFHSTDG